jgi:DNA-binding HxlR family transcriptional regulator
MDVEEGWILFLERNPHFYELTKGDFFIQFLEKISQGTTSFNKLKSLFPKVEEKDLQMIMEALTELRVIAKAEAGGQVFYSLTADGKKLLSTYRKTKKFYTT